MSRTFLKKRNIRVHEFNLTQYLGGLRNCDSRNLITCNCSDEQFF